MMANEARVLSKDSAEVKEAEHRQECDEIYNKIMETVRTQCDSGGRRFISVHMAVIHYSVIKRLEMDGYSVEDATSKGWCILHW